MDLRGSEEKWMKRVQKTFYERENKLEKEKFLIFILPSENEENEKDLRKIKWFIFFEIFSSLVFFRPSTLPENLNIYFFFSPLFHIVYVKISKINNNRGMKMR